jgi:hypothetical protein
MTLDQELVHARQGQALIDAMRIDLGPMADETIITVRKGQEYCQHTHINAQDARPLIRKTRELDRLLRVHGKNAVAECYTHEPVVIGPSTHKAARPNGDYRPTYGRFIKQNDIRFVKDEPTTRPVDRKDKESTPRTKRANTSAQDPLDKVIKALGRLSVKELQEIVRKLG